MYTFYEEATGIMNLKGIGAGAGNQTKSERLEVPPTIGLRRRLC
jgi:hypothetical protein